MISSLNQISLNSTGDVVGVGEVHGVAHVEGEPLRLGAQTGASWLRLSGTAEYLLELLSRCMNMTMTSRLS